MTILTETCAAAITAYGILTHGGDPIGRDILSQEAITFSIIENNAEVPEGLSSTLSSYFRLEPLVGRAAPLPDAVSVFEIRQTLSNWTNAPFSKVGLTENPDFLIYAYSKAAMGTEDFVLPTAYDNGQYMPNFEVPVIMVNVQPSSLDLLRAPRNEGLPTDVHADSIYRTISHGFGHAVLGIINTQNAAINFAEAGKDFEEDCTLEEAEHLFDETQGGVMSDSGSTDVGVYEHQAIKHILGLDQN